jgi:MraZ protein
MVTKGLDGCLSIYDMEGWKVLEDKLKSLPLTNANARKFSRFMLGGATECEVDKQGRILLPANLREFAHLTKDVALVGVGNRIEIWEKEAWAVANAYDDMEEIAENMEGLGI